ncbi:ABC transporter permease [candidate division KSB1 bacterium]
MKDNSINPPVFAEWLLSCMVRWDEKEFILGDLKEFYIEICRSSGRSRANLWYMNQIIKSFYHFLLDSIYWSSVMFRNYLVISLRSMLKRKIHSFINLGGLAIGLASGILIFLWIQGEISYENTHENADNIYRIYVEAQRGAETSFSSFTPGGASIVLKSEFEEVIESARFKIVISPPNLLVTYGSNSFLESKVAFADQGILEMFTIPFIRGDKSSALINPGSIVLTESMAKKYFGDEDPMGKLVLVDQQFAYLVTGIIEDVSPNTHLQFDMLVPFENIEDVMPSYRGTLESLGFAYYRNYVMLNENVSIDDFKEKVYNFQVDNNVSTTRLIRFQPIKDIHLKSGVIKDYIERGNIKYVYILSITCLLILITACINFVNLTTALSGFRAKEVGLRKVFGGYRRKLIGQFYFESAVYIFVALIISLILVYSLLPVFESITGKPVTFDQIDKKLVLGVIAIMVLVTSFLAGGYPAFLLSAFKPVRTLKSDFGFKSGKGMFRKVLVTNQFVITICLIIATIVIAKQFRYMLNRDLGYNQDNIVYFKLEGRLKEDHGIAKTMLLEHSGINGVTLVSSLMTRGTFGYNNVGWENMPQDLEPGANRMGTVSADADFMDVFEMNLLAGEPLSKQNEQISYRQILINESAARIMDNETPVGMRASMYFSDSLTVVGLVQDYNFRSLHFAIQPIVICNLPPLYNYMYIKVNSADFASTRDYIGQVYNEIEPNYPFDLQYLDESLVALYANDSRVNKLFYCFSGLVLLIACMGLFGLSTFSAESRTKEIGIRKTLGASTGSILKLVLKEFLIFMLIANFVALPLTYLALDKWLQNYAFRIDLSLIVFVFSGIVVFLIALSTISYHTIKAAIRNPVNALRYE